MPSLYGSVMPKVKLACIGTFVPPLPDSNADFPRAVAPRSFAESESEASWLSVGGLLEPTRIRRVSPKCT